MTLEGEAAFLELPMIVWLQSQGVFEGTAGSRVQ